MSEQVVLVELHQGLRGRLVFKVSLLVPQLANVLRSCILLWHFLKFQNSWGEGWWGSQTILEDTQIKAAFFGGRSSIYQAEPFHATIC